MNFAAIYHRAGDAYCYPLDNDTLEVNIKTAYDVEHVYLYYNDPFAGGILGGDWEWTGEEIELTKMKRLQHHKLWSVEVKPEFKRMKYYFKVCTSEETSLYFEDGFCTQQDIDESNKKLQCFTFPWLNPIDVSSVPAWAAKTIWYQIFPDRFRNGDLSIDAPHGLPWGAYEPSNEDTYNGDLRGIINKLDYLNDLGITGIYMTPIFLSPSNHKYDITDYYEIDPLFGDKETFRELVDKAHSRGIRIMLDGVFNHCGAQFDKWLDVLEKGPDSKYFHWFMIEQWPFDQNKHSTEGKEFYSFAFTSQMPKLNTNNPEVIAFICDVCGYWVEEFKIDGWRLDVANEVSHAVCKELRKHLHKINPDVYILGEIWHEAMPWLRGDEFDSVMNYPLTNAIDDFWKNANQSNVAFEEQYNNCYQRYMKQNNDVLFNLMDSHDTDRLIHRVGKNIDVFYQQLVVLFTSQGSTCFFYGTEIAIDGSHDPGCRACMPWEKIDAGEYDTEFATMKQLIEVRKLHEATRSDDIEFLYTTSNPRVIEYLKNSEQGSIRVVINASNDTVNVLNSNEEIIFARGVESGMMRPGGCMIAKK